MNTTSAGEARPINSIKTDKKRRVDFTLSVEKHSAAVIAHLRKYYGHFRGFADEEIDLEFQEDGTVRVVAYKETRA